MYVCQKYGLWHTFICARLMQFIQDIGLAQDHPGEKVMIAEDGKI